MKEEIKHDFIDLSHAKLNEDVASWQEKVNEVDASLQNGTCAGNDFIGWLHWDENYDKEEFARILETAKRIQENSDVLVVCGIGGSYLGPALRSKWSMVFTRRIRKLK